MILELLHAGSTSAFAAEPGSSVGSNEAAGDAYSNAVRWYLFWKL